MSENNPTSNTDSFNPSEAVVSQDQSKKERSARTSLGYGVFVLAGIFILIAVFCFLKFSGVMSPPETSSQSVSTKQKETDKQSEKSLGGEDEKATPVKKYKRGSPDYFVGGLAASLMAIGLIGFGIRQFSSSAQSATSGIPLIVEGGLMGALFGVVVSLFALGLAWNQQKVFFELTGPNFSDNILPALQLVFLFFIGLVISFVSLVLTRSQERVNPLVRRLIYGFSSTMLVVIVCLVILVLNGIVAVHVPNSLVTNETAFQGISPQSKAFLRSLNTPVKAYMIMPESNPRLYDGLYNDCRALLSDCRNASSLFDYEILTPGLHATRIAELLTQYQVSNEELGDSGKGILLVINDDPKRKTFFPARSLYRQEQGQGDGIDSIITFFEGENKLLSALISQLDDKSGQKIYFSQGHGEIPFDSVPPDPQGNHPDSLASYVNVLRENGYDVRPLNLSKEGVKVPDDCIVLILAEPSQTVPVNSPMQKALREYAARGGRILAFMPASYSQGKVIPTGLEEFFIDFGIRIEPDKRYVGGPTRVVIPNQGVILSFEELALTVPDKLSSPLAAAFRNTEQSLFGRDFRPVTLIPSPQNYVNQIVLTTPKRQLIWKEESERVNYNQVMRQFREDKNDEYARLKSLSDEDKPVVIVSSRADQPGEKLKPRLIFVACSQILPTSGDPRMATLARSSIVNDLIDHLRERDSQLGIQAKKLPTYKPTGTYDFANSVLFMLLTMAIVIGVGITVWFARRR